MTAVSCSESIDNHGPTRRWPTTSEADVARLQSVVASCARRPPPPACSSSSPPRWHPAPQWGSTARTRCLRQPWERGQGTCRTSATFVMGASVSDTSGDFLSVQLRITALSSIGISVGRLDGVRCPHAPCRPSSLPVRLAIVDGRPARRGSMQRSARPRSHCAARGIRQACGAGDSRWRQGRARKKVRAMILTVTEGHPNDEQYARTEAFLVEFLPRMKQESGVVEIHSRLSRARRMRREGQRRLPTPPVFQHGRSAHRSLAVPNPGRRPE